MPSSAIVFSALIPDNLNVSSESQGVSPFTQRMFAVHDFAQRLLLIGVCPEFPPAMTT